MFFKRTDEIIECIPNFSEGKDSKIIGAISESIRKVANVKLLHIDSGVDTNRTVITFAGKPDAVVEAAFNAIKTASDLIDMKLQKGTHPRFGATDVCPLVPVQNVSMEEVIVFSLKLAERVGEELKIPVYLYENSASVLERKNLSYLRKGNYEAIINKIHLPEWKPDFGPQQLNSKSGNIAIGARPFLIACNVNLQTKDVEVAKSIAREIRTSGSGLEKEGFYGNNRTKRCKALKAIGWYINEYNCAQVSMNITDITKTGIHEAFEAVKTAAASKNVTVNGMEIIGLVPKAAILAAGRYYSDMENKEINEEQELIYLAINRLGLNTLREFNPDKRILEYLL